MLTLDTIVNKLQNLHEDIRAEVVINDLMINNHISEDEYMIYKEGQFARTYRFDVLKIQNIDDVYRSGIQFTVSRDSMYDCLPEMVTHPIKTDAAQKEVDVMIFDYQEQKRRQKAARAFFQPYEHEIFSHGVAIENWEREFLQNLNNGLSHEMFYDFWGIPKDIPKIPASKLIRLLPYAYKIAGNISLTSDILTFILNEKVNIEVFLQEQYEDPSEAVTMGNTTLGVDFIPGTSYDDYSMSLKIYIGPLKNFSLEEFIHEGDMKKLLTVFYDFFFPLELQISTHIVLSENEELFKLDEKNTFLGYNSKI